MPPRQDIRLGTADDAAEVARLFRDFQAEYDEPCPDVRFLTERYAQLLGAGEMVVLLGGEGPDGFAQLRLRPWVYSPRSVAYLEELYVAPAQRGHGLGRALLERSMEAARDEGAEHIELNTGETDTAARSLYESAGFTNREKGPNGPLMLYYERELRA